MTYSVSLTTRLTNPLKVPRNSPSGNGDNTFGKWAITLSVTVVQRDGLSKNAVLEKDG